MSGYCKECGNIDCICEEMDKVLNKQESCRHIYGYSDIDNIHLIDNKYILADDMKGPYKDYIYQFTFCPKCGKRLIDE